MFHASLYLLLVLSVTQPLILEKFPATCSYSSRKKNVSFLSKLWTVSNDSYEIYYSLCDNVPESINCGKNVKACLFNKHDNSIYPLAFGFSLVGAGNSLMLHGLNNSSCQTNSTRQNELTIRFLCFNDIQEPYLKLTNNDCEFEINMMSPNCIPKCTVKIYDQFIDLNPLRGNYYVHSNKNNFSVSICHENEKCGKSGITSCALTNDIIPLSTYDSEHVVYHLKTNEIGISGTYKKLNKIFELILKCNWDKKSTDIYHKELPNQGKHYKFEMQSFYGCIKLPSMCVVNENFLIYNLTGLYKKMHYWKVSNVTKGSIFLNICGPLKLETADNPCTRAFSQVCEVSSDGKFINRGSVSTDLKIENDVLEMNFVNGGVCKDDPFSFKQYSTYVKFYCSNVEKGPEFIKYEECDTFLKWNTPLACPIYSKSSCDYFRPIFNNCSLSFQDREYDLGRLTLYNSSYKIKDGSSNIEYLLNVCGPVVESDAPCMNDAMVAMKNLSEHNLKYRTMSLGKMIKLSIANEELVIETGYGSYCDENDYSTVIYFKCNDKEEGPKKIESLEKCSFQFLWKTPSACPKKTVTGSKICSYYNSVTNKLMDFSKTKKAAVKIMYSESTYITIDICQENYTECRANEPCVHFPLTKNLHAHINRTYFEFILPKKCELQSEFNKIELGLICDRIENNEHYYYNSKSVNNCTLVLELRTHQVCSTMDSRTLYKTDSNNEYEFINHNGKKENCTIINQYTGYKFDINSLKLNMYYLKCPKIIFNQINSSVSLTYLTAKTCKNLTTEGFYDEYKYKVLLICSENTSKVIQNEDCLKLYKFENPEFCKLLEKSVLETRYSLSAGVISLIVSAVLISIGLIVFVYFKYKPCRRSIYSKFYAKDGDL